MGTAPLVPAPLLQGFVWQGGAGRRLLQPPPSPGTSLFFFQLVTPTTPGAHNITVIAAVSGTASPVAASVVSGGPLLHLSERNPCMHRYAGDQVGFTSCKGCPAFMSSCCMPRSHCSGALRRPLH